ncbi:TolC family protein [Aporhodopirellula aestuarii]|uniref:TolC family protein n=1 Tax=Aporhodopirellula aestuarii TaxID=2950107 RepID=A0ABT0UDA4_9BACT|nr:TolC family protein [Aporhodopirellula aestuarii]MCM2374868.1 TolC family protein [Aporhodopirellula aestuarii]
MLRPKHTRRQRLRLRLLRLLQVAMGMRANVLKRSFARTAVAALAVSATVLTGYWTAPGAGAADSGLLSETSSQPSGVSDAKYWQKSSTVDQPSGQSDPSFAEFLKVVSEKESSTPRPVETVLAKDPESNQWSLPNEQTEADIETRLVSGDPPWWQPKVHGYLLDSPNYLQFDIATLLSDTLQSSPRISAITNRTSIAYEKIIQQDAAFDPAILLETGIDRVNDPVGSKLTTGGPPRLIQDSWTANAGLRQSTRQGTIIDVSQEVGTLTSNSTFFEPAHQGNSRLNVSITQPLMATSGRVYNTRLVTAASIDSRIAWQQLRLDLESHLVETLTTFWRLHERRSHYVQQLALIERGQQIGEIVMARGDFDSGPLQRIKVTRRLAADNDRLIELRAEVRRLQVRLKTLVGSPMLTSLDDSIELIPTAQPNLPEEELNVRDCIVRGLEYRGDIQAATQQVAAAGLEVDVTRNELLPRLNAVIEAYLAGLSANNNIGQSWINQYSDGGPGVTAALTYNLPWGRRAAKSRNREARLRYQQRSDELRDALLTARREIESSVIRVNAGAELRRSKAATLAAAVREEEIATRRWTTLAGDGGPTALILEDLLETQKRRTEAEQSYVTAQVSYILELVALQQAMGTFLIREGIEPTRSCQSTDIDILQTAPIDEQLLPLETWTSPTLHSDGEELPPAQSLIWDSQLIEPDREDLPNEGFDP